MAESPVKDEAAAKNVIAEDARAFLEAHDHRTELGVFQDTWRIYKDLPLSRFRKAVAQIDRMILPGMEAQTDVANIVIQTLGGVWQEILDGRGVLAARELYKLVKEQALEAGATRALAGSIADFYSERYPR